jgi:hypothetical protein
MHPIVTLKATKGQNNTLISEEISDRWYIILTVIIGNYLPGKIVPAENSSTEVFTRRTHGYKRKRNCGNGCE